MKQSIVGFNLIEMMIALSIACILVLSSIPLYINYFVAERRQEAESALSQLALAMEHYSIEHDSYEGANLMSLHFPVLIANNSYELKINTVSAEDYILLARPLNTQAKHDTDCGTLILNATGEKNITGAGKIETCWRW